MSPSHSPVEKPIQVCGAFGARMRAAVHPDRARLLVGADVVLDRDRAAASSGPSPPRCAGCAGRGRCRATTWTRHCSSGSVMRDGSQLSAHCRARVVDRQPEIVAELRPGQPFRLVLVVDRLPDAGEVHLRLSAPKPVSDQLPAVERAEHRMTKLPRSIVHFTDRAGAADQLDTLSFVSATVRALRTTARNEHSCAPPRSRDRSPRARARGRAQPDIGATVAQHLGGIAHALAGTHSSTSLPVISTRRPSSVAARAAATRMRGGPMRPPVNMISARGIAGMAQDELGGDARALRKADDHRRSGADAARSLASSSAGVADEDRVSRATARWTRQRIHEAMRIPLPTSAAGATQRMPGETEPARRCRAFPRRCGRAHAEHAGQPRPPRGWPASIQFLPASDSTVHYLSSHR